MTAEKDSFAGDDFYAFSFAGFAFGPDDFAPNSESYDELQSILRVVGLEQDIVTIFSSSNPMEEFVKALQGQGIEARTNLAYGYVIYPAVRRELEPSPHPTPIRELVHSWASARTEPPRPSLRRASFQITSRSAA